MTERQGYDAAKPLSDRQFDLAEEWLAHLKADGGPMPEPMRRRFFELFWEEQVLRSREGRPLRIPPGTDAHDAFLLGTHVARVA